MFYHAVVLNLHQPAGNLEHLLDTEPWEAEMILQAMDRIPRSLWGNEDVGRVHLSLSGTLLETLSSPGFQERVYGSVDCGSLLWHLQNEKIISIVGTGYYHPVFPLIPSDDRPEQMKRWKDQASHLFWRDQFQGFWPPEMGFSMEMIPLLKRMGYRYVLVDSLHVEPVTPMDWRELYYRPHIARYGDDEIIVVVRDRDTSESQESGTDYGWLAHHMQERLKGVDFPPLLVTATDGENGNWFRNVSDGANFWTGLYREIMQRARGENPQIKPTFIEEYLDKHGTYGEVKVRTGAWNTGWHNGVGFTQWTGSQMQKDAFSRVGEVSARFHQLQESAEAHGRPTGHLQHELHQAHWRLLRAETSCNFFWGEAWVHRVHEDLDMVERHLHEAAKFIG
uniref:Putative GH57: related to a-amylase n=1 Tax=Magnetococcus massalia (strain MO-1) TaxID=451514 RepID=A0A1S7LHD7_MAGMO|nr:Putative GH57 : related to a-amylase [Candidatus Magnetococcus massalia]